MIKYQDFKKKRRFALEQVVPALQNVGLHDKAKKILLCSNFYKVAICRDCGSAHYNGSYSCKDKFCPVCQKKRSLLWLTKLIPICRDLLDRGYHLNMLTYTIRVTDNMSLKQSLDILQSSFRYMTHDYKQSAKIYNELILGGVRSLEVKIGEDKDTKELTGLWHPHYHILVCTHGKVKYKELHKILYDMWNHSIKIVAHSKDTFCGSVNISSIKARDEQQLLEGLLEIVKYMTKFDWQGANVHELVTTMHKQKLQNSFGNFKYLISDKDVELALNKSMTELQESFCTVCGSSEFVELDMYNTGRLYLYDLNHKHRKYLDIQDDDLILCDEEDIC